MGFLSAIFASSLPCHLTFSSNKAYDPPELVDNQSISAVNYGITHVQQGLSAGQGHLIEMLLTMMLVMVFVHTTMEKTEFRSVAPITVGFALAAGVAAR